MIAPSGTCEPPVGTHGRYTRGVMKVQHQTYLQRRGGRYYARMRVPDDLRGHYKNKREFIRSLRTHDRREAERRLAPEIARLRSEFHAVRARLAKTELRIEDVDGL